MIKKIMLALCLFCAVGVLCAQKVPAATDVLEQAFSKGKSMKKNVIVIFHASWCGWCKKMDASINDAACKSFFDDNYVIEHLTILESKDKKELENPGAEDLFKKYAPEDSGIPFWIIYDTAGKVLATAIMKDGENTGCPAAENEVQHWIEALKLSSNINEETSRVIFNRFRKNDSKYTAN